MKTVYWTDERLMELKAYAREGLTACAVAEIYGKTSSAIRKQANKRGIRFAGGYTDWTAEEEAILRRMVSEGFGWKDIAKDLPDRSVNSVTGYAFRHAKPKPAPPTIRKGLVCGDNFPSSWKGNRICKKCTSSKTYQTEGSAFA